MAGRLAHIAFPIGLSYFNTGYWVYRHLFQRTLNALLPNPLLETNASLSAELTMTYQPATTDHAERCMVHVVNWSPLRQSPRHPTFYEDPIALTDVTLVVRPPTAVTRAKAIIAGVDLPIVQRADGSIEVTLPRVPVHEIVCLSKEL